MFNNLFFIVFLFFISFSYANMWNKGEECIDKARTLAAQVRVRTGGDVTAKDLGLQQYTLELFNQLASHIPEENRSYFDRFHRLIREEGGITYRQYVSSAAILGFALTPPGTKLTFFTRPFYDAFKLLDSLDNAVSILTHEVFRDPEGVPNKDPLSSMTVFFFPFKPKESHLGITTLCKAYIERIVPVPLATTSIKAHGMIFPPFDFIIHDMLHGNQLYTRLQYEGKEVPGFRTFLCDQAKNAQDPWIQKLLNIFLYLEIHELDIDLVEPRSLSIIDWIEDVFERMKENLGSMSLKLRMRCNKMHHDQVVHSIKKSRPHSITRTKAAKKRGDKRKTIVTFLAYNDQKNQIDTFSFPQEKVRFHQTFQQDIAAFWKALGYNLPTLEKGQEYLHTDLDNGILQFEQDFRTWFQKAQEDQILPQDLMSAVAAPASD
jgi:hypothetical protein